MPLAPFGPVPGFLDRVDFALLARWLARNVRPHLYARALTAATGPGGVDLHQLLAGLVIVAGEVLNDAAAVAGHKLAPAEIAALRGWLAATARRVHGRTAIARSGPILNRAREQSNGSLVVGEALATLPLLELARDLAPRLGGLVVTVGALGSVCGLADADRGGAAVVILDPDAAAASGRELGQVFAHELAHLLDPGPGLVDRAEAERFAEALGGRLLEAGPQSVAAAQPLVEAALAGRACVEWEAILDGLRSELHFTGVKLTAEDLQSPYGAAWSTPGTRPD